MRIYEYLDEIRRALNAEESSGVPTPSWRIEEYLKDIYDAIRSGIYPSDEQVAEAIDAWLDDHPEATTTVQDGSITNAKLASSFVTPGTAAAYSSSATYAVGDYVFHGGALYRCITAITTAEAWTSAHWTAVALGDDVSNLKSALTNTESILFDDGFGHLIYDAFVRGRWSTDGRSFSSAENRVSTIDELTAGFEINFKIASGFRAYFWTLNGSTYTGSGWITGGYTISKGAIYKITISRVTEITETANIKEFVDALNIPFAIKLENEQNYGTLLVDQLANVAITDNTIARPKRATMYGDIALPYSPITINVGLPSDMACEFHFFNASRTKNKETGTLYNGSTAVSLAASLFYKVSIWYTDNRDVVISEVENLIADGSISFTFDWSYNAVDDNTENIKNAIATGIKIGASNRRTQRTLPTFLHISDIHGDAVRLENAYRIANNLGVTGLINTGDSAVYSYAGSCSTFPVTIAKKYNVPTLVSIGNHDAYGAQSDTELYNMFVAYFSQTYEYATNSKPYFYKDFSTEKLRVISLNLYDGGRPTNSSKCTISQTQINWLISTLNSVPADYGVILMYHAVESSYEGLTAVNANWKQAYFREWYDQSGGITGYPIINIIDAYIAKSTYEGTYTQVQADMTTTETISVSADFTNAGGEFVCHVCGHEHMDVIGYYNGAINRQLVLMITCGCCFFGTGTSNAYADNSDLPRSYQETQDAVNVYGIDMDAGVVKIARVGADKNADFVVRDVLTAPYK